METPTGWSGTISEPLWQSRDESEEEASWVPFDDKLGSDPASLTLPKDAESGIRSQTPSTVLYHMTPGQWRVRIALTDSKKITYTPWAYVYIADHEQNRSLMRGEAGRELQRAWQWAASNSKLGDSSSAPPGGLTGVANPQTNDAIGDSLLRLRAVGASSELYTRAETLYYERECQRLSMILDKDRRTRAARELHSKLGQLKEECPEFLTPLGGQRGQVIQLEWRTLQQFDPERAARLLRSIQSDWPQFDPRLSR